MLVQWNYWFSYRKIHSYSHLTINRYLFMSGIIRIRNEYSYYHFLFRACSSRALGGIRDTLRSQFWYSPSSWNSKFKFATLLYLIMVEIQINNESFHFIFILSSLFIFFFSFSARTIMVMLMWRILKNWVFRSYVCSFSYSANI